MWETGVNRSLSGFPSGSEDKLDAGFPVSDYGPSWKEIFGALSTPFLIADIRRRWQKGQTEQTIRASNAAFSR